MLSLHRRPANFHRVLQAVVLGSAAVSRIIFTMNGSPHADEFRALIEEAKRDAAVVARGVQLDLVESSVEVGFYFRFLRARALELLEWAPCCCV